MRYAFLLLTAAAAALLLGSCSDSEEELPGDGAQAMSSATTTASPAPASTGPWTAPSGTPVPKPGWKAFQFLTMTVSAPDWILAHRAVGYTFSPTEYYDRPVIVIEPRDGGYVRVVIDAETGTVIDQAGSEQERAALQPVLDTVRMSPFDPKTAPWPYADTAPPDQWFAWGEITYPVPDPLSGISVGVAVGDGGPPGECNTSISVSNGRSRVVINACTGEPFRDLASVDPEDGPAFDRFVKAIEVKP